MQQFNDQISVLKAVYSVPVVGQVLNIATTAVVIYYTGGCVQCGIAVSSALSSLQAGVTSGKFSEAFKAGAIAGAEAEAFYGIGTATGFHGATWDYATDNAGMYALNVAGHAAVGCISAAAAGGDCGPQALAAGISAAAAPVLNSEFPDPNHNLGDLIGGTVASATVGGLSAVAGGGKFESGAVTASFGYLFNDALLLMVQVHNPFDDEKISVSPTYGRGLAFQYPGISGIFHDIPFDWGTASSTGYDLTEGTAGGSRGIWDRIRQTFVFSITKTYGDFSTASGPSTSATVNYGIVGSGPVTSGAKMIGRITNFGVLGKGSTQSSSTTCIHATAGDYGC